MGTKFQRRFLAALRFSVPERSRLIESDGGVNYAGVNSGLLQARRKESASEKANCLSGASLISCSTSERVRLRTHARLCVRARARARACVCGEEPAIIGKLRGRGPKLLSSFIGANRAP